MSSALLMPLCCFLCITLEESHDMPSESPNETFEVQIGCRLSDAGLRAVRRHDETCRAVHPLQHEMPAEELIAFAIGRTLKNQIYHEIGFFISNRHLHTRTVFEQEEIAKKGFRGMPQGSPVHPNPMDLSGSSPAIPFVHCKHLALVRASANGISLRFSYRL